MLFSLASETEESARICLTRVEEEARRKCYALHALCAEVVGCMRERGRQVSDRGGLLRARSCDILRSD